jgi:Fe-S-cluster containining protein
VLRYECDKCGACCKGSLIIEADDLDVLREPRLIDADRHHAGKSVDQMVHEIQTEWKAILLACGSPCLFLGTDNRCSIYPTRPNVCVGMQAGDEQCQEARAAVCLPPLLPVDDTLPAPNSEETP